MHRSSPTRARRFLLGLAVTVTSAFANVDGTLDTSLTSPPNPGLPGLFRFAWDLGGGAPTTNADTSSAITPLPDGGFLVAGYAWNTSSGHDQYACTMARFMESGLIDPAFGLGGFGGKIVENFGASSGSADCYPLFVATTGDGKIIWGGSVFAGVDHAWLQRLNPDGTADASFGGDSTSFYVGGNNTALTSLVVDGDGSLYAAGYTIPANFSDSDFYLLVLDPDGVFQYSRNVFFDLGGDHNDQAKTLVLQQIPGTSCGTSCLIPAHSELYLVGVAANAPYQNLANRDCAVAAFRKELFATQFTVDSFFGPAADGRMSIDFPVGNNTEVDNDCRVAVARAGAGYQQVGQGIVVGGENYFISTLGGGTPGLASNYALVDIDPAGNVTRDDAFAFFQELPTPGIYNGIFAMAREPGGRIVVTGYAGSSATDRAPSDVGVIRFNADYSRDATFGNDGAGLAILTLDQTLPVHQREWGTSLAVDVNGRILLAGERSSGFGNSGDYDWLVARLTTSDVIFRDGIDGVVR